MDAFVVEAKRTPIGRSHKDKGIFRTVRADELLAGLLEYFAKEAMPADQLDDIYIGCVGQHLEQGKNIARLSALLAGYPEQVPGVTLNRLCGSSLQALNFAAMALQCGQAKALLAGGVEHMQHVSMTACLDYHPQLFVSRDFQFTNMGLTSDRVAVDFRISRREQDEFTLLSHQKAVRAQSAGVFKNEIIPVQTDQGLIRDDQCPRPTTSLEALEGLQPIFQEGGTTTAGNSSPLSDGASLVLLVSQAAGRRLSLPMRAQIMDFAIVGLDPCLMGLGPIPAIQTLLKKQSMSIDDIDLFEINEAFASQAIASIRELKIPEGKVNIGGGAIALGHPLGATGTRLITTLLHHLERTDGELGMAAMCVGHGQGMATLIKRVM